MEGEKSATKPEAGFEKSRRNYEKAANTLAVLVEEIQGLSVPEKTIQDWKTLLSAIRVVDDRIDHTMEVAKRNLLVEKIKSSLKGTLSDFSSDADLENAMQNIQNLSAGLGEEKEHFFHNLLSVIMKVTEEIKVEEDPQAVVRLTQLEGQITAKLFLPFLPEEFRQSGNYQKLVHALARLGRAANSFDTLIDLPTDYKNKGVRIKPTVFNRVLFLGAVLSNSSSMLKDTGLSKNLIEEFLSHAKDTTENNSEK